MTQEMDDKTPMRLSPVLTLQSLYYRTKLVASTQLPKLTEAECK